MADKKTQKPEPVPDMITILNNYVEKFREKNRNLNGSQFGGKDVR